MAVKTLAILAVVLAVAVAPALADEVTKGKTVGGAPQMGNRRLLQDDHWCWTYVGAGGCDADYFCCNGATSPLTCVRHTAINSPNPGPPPCVQAKGIFYQYGWCRDVCEHYHESRTWTPNFYQTAGGK